ncbi:hypothetical protein T492DRAFT_1107871 [Pavlovales sp. CCMP2436]|nr:hypothetical protein T492DRAFT_1107871 [Pavlovales sp. CCMP2436]
MRTIAPLATSSPAQPFPLHRAVLRLQQAIPRWRSAAGGGGNAWKMASIGVNVAAAAESTYDAWRVAGGVSYENVAVSSAESTVRLFGALVAVPLVSAPRHAFDSQRIASRIAADSQVALFESARSALTGAVTLPLLS